MLPLNGVQSIRIHFLKTLPVKFQKIWDCVSEWCFHDTLLICVHMHLCEKPLHATQNLLAILEKFFPSLTVSVTSFSDTMRFSLVVKETLAIKIVRLVWNRYDD